MPQTVAFAHGDVIHFNGEIAVERRGIELCLPCRLRPRFCLRDQRCLVGRSELLEHGTVGDEHDRREEVAGQCEVFLDFIETGAGNGRHRIFLPVEPAILERGIDQRKFHRDHFGTERLERHLIDRVRDDTNLQTLDIVGAANRPLGIRDVAEALSANRQQGQPLIAEFGGDCGACWRTGRSCWRRSRTSA